MSSCSTCPAPNGASRVLHVNCCHNFLFMGQNRHKLVNTYSNFLALTTKMHRTQHACIEWWSPAFWTAETVSTENAWFEVAQLHACAATNDVWLDVGCLTWALVGRRHQCSPEHTARAFSTSVLSSVHVKTKWHHGDNIFPAPAIASGSCSTQRHGLQYCVSLLQGNLCCRCDVLPFNFNVNKIQMKFCSHGHFEGALQHLFKLSIVSYLTIVSPWLGKLLLEKKFHSFKYNGSCR